MSINWQVTNEAIQRAVEKADKDCPEWSEQAYTFLKEYAEINAEFMVEDVRAASHGIVPEPKNKKAWGGVIRRAAFEGIVYKGGIRNVKNIKAHLTPAHYWKSAIVKQR